MIVFNEEKSGNFSFLFPKLYQEGIRLVEKNNQDGLSAGWRIGQARWNRELSLVLAN